jgi:hypothetical protein
VTNHAHHPARRNFLRAATAVGAAALVGFRSGRAAAEPPPEIRSLRLVQFASGCQGPIHVAEDLLRGEGFTEVSYVKAETTQATTRTIGIRGGDIGLQFAAPFIAEIDRGTEIVTLGGCMPAALCCSAGVTSAAFAISRERLFPFPSSTDRTPPGFTSRAWPPTWGSIP